MQKLIKTSARRFASLVPKNTGSEAVIPVYNEKLAESHPKLMYKISLTSAGPIQLTIPTSICTSISKKMRLSSLQSKLLVAHQ